MRRLNYPAAKRAIDIVLSIVGLLVTAPLMLVIAMALQFTEREAVLFKQARTGLKGRPFTLYKFRSFPSSGTGPRTVPSSLGRWLRRYGLDELPQLWNVLRGDMSLIGPRPLLPQYLTRYNVEQARRHEVRPGLTGLAQISGGNLISWERQFELDVLYVDTRCFRLDTLILWGTLPYLAARRHAHADDFIRHTEFQGAHAQPHQPN